VSLERARRPELALALQIGAETLARRRIVGLPVQHAILHKADVFADGVAAARVGAAAAPAVRRLQYCVDIIVRAEHAVLNVILERRGVYEQDALRAGARVAVHWSLFYFAVH
jgi:hypothetical protein